MAPRWWLDAHNPPQLQNAYRPRVAVGPAMVLAARDIPGADSALLAETEAMLRERLPLFDEDVPVLVHGDIHGHNILGVERRAEPPVSGILDWEGAHKAAPDVELDMLLRWASAAHDFPESPDRQVGSPQAIASVSYITSVRPIPTASPGRTSGSDSRSTTHSGTSCSSYSTPTGGGTIQAKSKAYRPRARP